MKEGLSDLWVLGISGGGIGCRIQELGVQGLGDRALTFFIRMILLID